MYWIKFFLVTVLNVNTGILSLSWYLQAISEPLKTPRLAKDLFSQLTKFFGSLEISPLSNLISSTLTPLSLGLVFCLTNFHCSFFVGSFWRKLMQKLLSASLILLLTKFLRRLNSLYVSLSRIFFHLLNKNCFWAIKCFNSCVIKGLELLKLSDPFLTVWIGACFSTISSKLSMKESNISLPFLYWYILHHSDRARSLLNLEPEKNQKFLIVFMLSLSDFNERGLIRR